MNELKFIHLTDTHLLKDYKDSFLAQLDDTDTNPTNQLTRILKFAEHYKDSLDFVLITGDLVHEGDQADYQLFKSVLEEHTSLPVYLSLGNHDVTQEYWKVFHGKVACNDELYYTKEIKGYRLIVLDSSFDKTGAGYVSEEQLTWLENVLESPSDNGSIIAIHHPIDLDQSFGEHSLKNSNELVDILENKDVIAVLSGHIHQNLIESYPSFISSAAEGTCFGVELNGEKADFTNNSAFNVCTIKDSQIKFQVNRVPKTNKVLFSYNLN